MIPFLGYLLTAACTSSTGVVPPTTVQHSSQTVQSLVSNPTRTARPASPTIEKQATREATASATPPQPLKTTSAIPNRATETNTPLPPLGEGDWQKLPIVPEPGERVVEIYQRGLELGNNPHAFSKVGDCGSTPSWFLGDFDRGKSFYSLGEYQYLNPVIQMYRGSFERTSLAARSGFNTSSLLTTLWTDLDSCQVTETPLECEYRLQKPAVAFITLGTNDAWHPEEFEPDMRQIIEYSIESGVIPILATKADNFEGDNQINARIADLAREYEIPLWNYWLAVQPLPGHGLQEDGTHLTWGRNFFDNPEDLTKAWPVRNLTALQVLNQVWLKITGQSG